MSEANKKAVQDFLNLAFNEKRPEEAAAVHLHPDYVQHNPHAPSGATASGRFLRDFVDQFPLLRLAFKRVLADGDYVIVHGHMRLTPESRGSAIVDIVRFEGDRIIEHWDVVQDIPEHSANDNTMF
ncbi:nuclear transport factor 2 family protein [Allokutzneria sp. NRRL B-24872]|uniref:nuclear transport factor 2 family protein n=1 Tax=Allokutzneria sp. NRRL B-24872 TaxID=1137961 RepID=UPI001FEDA78F|nr:nuclear transport factor 2 family protein [Allokutzneria sp. NRRL B-24872]